ncbi:unnamed protein product [Penicillium salamii]|uniref:Uncharacterized protein n=1 Tax=Penicillium salamii TaxID=1612424 RepID=A0A9W4ILJ7_9EURO|nr:unnamed protein product [Penicillium salamii]CAG8027673.1 unnamed protein product [Penicillium salamii]CAG8036522.1 unnamed protein product [Penicillium salamii]CAG8058468.1 unnamed protein product [Penicillium salamii]CAG8086367.1 unnamed protein product [Penicillium salamii]
MASSDLLSDTSRPHPTENPIFTVKFTWKDWQGKIFDTQNPASEPIYIIDFPFKFASKKAASMIFKNVSTEDVVGSGKLNLVSINPGYKCHGQEGQLLAQKRFSTLYTYRSLNFSTNDKPVTMTWSSNLAFKTWDFVCVDEQQNAVAKFSGNAWGVTDIGKIEFDGPKKHDRAAQEELMVTGITLFYCMMVRCNNVFNLFGAIFSRPGRKEHIDPQPRTMAGEGATERP